MNVLKDENIHNYSSKRKCIAGNSRASAPVVDIAMLTLSDLEDNKDDFSGFQDN